MSAPGRIARYEILEPLGAGGMGTVYAAFDPELSRKVAVKLIDLPEGEEDAAHVLAEARAMARLAHPNVAAVHDAGQVDGQVFIAMDLVGTRNVAEWLREQKPGWREVLAVFVAAGRGLCAAHAAGIVHRDFKPANILLGDDGRAQVTDFGLALSLAGPDPLAMELAGGTPSYMSPEQVMGKPLDARSDQFSFCVSLYEALAGRRPFAVISDGEVPTTMAVASEILQGRHRPLPEWLPAWLRRAVQRGLAVDPEARWPSLAALLDILESTPRRRRRRVALALATAAVAAAATGAALVARRDPGASCSGFDARLAGVWDGPRRAAVSAAFAAAGQPAAATPVLAGLDERAAAWVAGRTDTCTAARVHRDQSPQATDLRVACLDARLGELGALTQALTRVEGGAVWRAADAVRALAPASACADVAALSQLLPEPTDPARRAAIAPARAAVAESRAQSLLGKYVDATASARRALEAAQVTDWAPVRAEALLQLGEVLASAGAQREALATLDLAVVAAEEGRHDRVRALALIGLLRRLGDARRSVEEIRRVAAQGEAVVARVGARELQLAILDAHAWALTDLFQLDEALPFAQRGIAEAAGAGDERALGEAENTFAHILHVGDHNREAAVWAEKSVAATTSVYGRQHPEVAAKRSNVAIYRFLAGDGEGGLAEMREVLAINSALYGEDHPQTVEARHNVASALTRLGRAAESLPLLERNLAGIERTYGPTHPNTGRAYFSLGNAQLALGRAADAVTSLQHALAIEKGAPTPDPRNVAAYGDALGRALWDADPARRPEAHALVVDARERVVTGRYGPQILALIDGWLATHRL